MYNSILEHTYNHNPVRYFLYSITNYTQHLFFGKYTCSLYYFQPCCNIYSGFLLFPLLFLHQISTLSDCLHKILQQHDHNHEHKTNYMAAEGPVQMPPTLRFLHFLSQARPLQSCPFSCMRSATFIQIDFFFMDLSQKSSKNSSTQSMRANTILRSQRKSVWRLATDGGKGYNFYGVYSAPLMSHQNNYQT